MSGPDPYQDLLTRLRNPDVGRVGAREMLREVLRRLPAAWDARVLDAALELMRRFPPLAAEFPLLRQMASVPVTTVVERALGREEDILASIAVAGREEAAKLLDDLSIERGREKDGRARLLLALGKRLLELRDRKGGRHALQEAARVASGPTRAEIDALLDDLPGAKGREWRAARGTVSLPGNPSEVATVRVKGPGAPARAFVEERLLAAPLLVPCSNPRAALTVEVTLEHDTRRVRPASLRPAEPTTAPMIGLVARDAEGAALGISCGAFVSPLERFPGIAIAPEVTHVSIRGGATFAETRLEPVGPPKEGDGWRVMRSGRAFVRTRGGCWLRHPEAGPAPSAADTRVRFRVTRAGLVWVAVDVHES